MSQWYYICDSCGSIVTITDAQIPEDEAWVCADCGSARMWEFTNKVAAMRHSHHIQDFLLSARSAHRRPVGR